MGQIRVKDGVIFGTELAAAGCQILSVLKSLVQGYDFDVTITSARDGAHSGPDDPHHSGEAFDLRINDLTPAQASRLLHDLQTGLYREPRRFFAFLEASGTSNQHLHVQRRSGTTYSVLDYLNNS
jgi:hypothetical protein